jgi:quinol-cytochrome oxidoreductase complex cytochrome b subunit
MNIQPLVLYATLFFGALILIALFRSLLDCVDNDPRNRCSWSSDQIDRARYGRLRKTVRVTIAVIVGLIFLQIAIWIDPTCDKNVFSALFTFVSITILFFCFILLIMTCVGNFDEID